MATLQDAIKAFIETYTTHTSQVNRRNRIKEFAANAGAPLETIAEREAVRLLLDYNLSKVDGGPSAYSMSAMLAEQDKAKT